MKRLMYKSKNVLKQMVYNSVGQETYTLLTVDRVGLTSTWT